MARKAERAEAYKSGNTHEPTLGEARKWNEAYEKGYSLGYENGRNEQKPTQKFRVGPKPQIIRYNEHVAISFWACGAIICIYDILYFIQEDDGNWFVHEDKYQPALQSCFSIGWIESFTDALNRLKEYVWTNGTPVYYSGTDIICHYSIR